MASIYFKHQGNARCISQVEKAKTKMNKNGFSKLMDFFALEWIVRI